MYGKYKIDKFVETKNSLRMKKFVFDKNTLEWVIDK